MAESKTYIATITSKGQVTIPVQLREELGLAPQDKVVFRMVEGNKVEMEPLPMTLEEAYGSVPPITQPEDFAALQQIAQEEREEGWLHKTNR